MSFPRYPKYKASGVEWLGDVPEGWAVKRLDFLASVKARLGWKGLTASEYVPEGFIFLATPNIKGEGEIDFANVNYITAERYNESPEIMVQVGDVLIAKDGSTLGTTNVVHHLPAPTTVNSSIAILRPKPALNSSYFFRWITSAYLQSIIQSMKDGQGVPHLFQEDIRKFSVLLPPLPEQTAIAEFLDRETGKIDGLVAEQRRLMELLKEKRQAVISHAVTKGLNPHAPMKPSGIEWLGDVPAGWEVMSLRRCKKRIQTGGTPPTADQSYYEDGTVPWFGPGSFDENLTVSEPIKWLNESAVKEGVARVFAAGATMIVTIGATLGKVSSLVEDGSCNQQITVIEFDPRRVCARFATYQIKRLEPALRAIAPSATLPILGLGEVADIDMVIPPLADQVATVAHLDSELTKFDTLTAEAQCAIDLLQERRTALISAAVTGQIDVRQQTRN